MDHTSSEGGRIDAEPEAALGSGPGLLELRARLERGEAASRDLVMRAVDLAEIHRDLGAFVRLNPELAVAEAEAADASLAELRGRGADPFGRRPLLGLPTAHKDLVDVRGVPTTHGSLAVPHAEAAADDPIAATVREAGAVSIGKTQVPEFGIAGYSENLVAPPARNPHDPSRTAGGSSGGTAAAIAAGILPGAIGSDAGGSIRIPAAACGLVGLKPGRGAVPADRVENGRDPSRAVDDSGAPRMGVSGPIARTAADAALLYDSLFRDPLPVPVDSALAVVRRTLGDPATLRGLRVGVSLASPFEGWADIRFAPGAISALEAGIAALEAAGHRVEEAVFDYGGDYPEHFTRVWTAGLPRIPLAPGDEGLLGDLARMFLDRARATPPQRLAESAAALRAFAGRTAAQWAEYDVVLTPALAFPAPRIGEFWASGPAYDYRLQCEWAPQTSMVNVVGTPAITVPTVRTGADGTEGPGAPPALPMGVQLIGRRGAELLLLQIAAQLLGA